VIRTDLPFSGEGTNDGFERHGPKKHVAGSRAFGEAGRWTGQDPRLIDEAGPP